MTFQTQLRRLRDSLGLTQEATAKILDVSKSTYEKWETGVKVPKPLTQEGAIARLSKGKKKDQTKLKA